MTFLRGLGQDLIDKRLWPIALVLVVAIIAAPTVLARGGGGDAVVPTASAPPEGLRAAVVETAEPGDGPTEGSLRNPFFDPPEEEVPAGEGATIPASTKPAGTGASSGASGGTGTKDTTSTGTSDGTSGTGTTEPSTTDDKNSSGDDSTDSSSKGSGESGYDLSIRFGLLSDEGELETKKDLPRLTPLPTADAPLFVYMGVLSGGKTAVFLLGDGIASTEGDGTCRPSETLCETLELDKGETQFLTAAAPAVEGEAPPQYQLDVVSLTKRGSGKASASKASKAAKARKAKKAAKAAKAGRSVVRKARKRGAAETLDRYRYDAASGVIRRLTLKQRARARASASAGLRVRRTGTVIASGALPG